MTDAEKIAIAKRWFAENFVDVSIVGDEYKYFRFRCTTAHLESRMSAVLIDADEAKS